MTISTTPRRRLSIVVETDSGRIRGTREKGITTFRGIPYARPPTGALRFCSPRGVRPWAGVRAATAFGAPSLQAGLAGSAEDSLHANVWTPDVRGARPVLVYVHGGGWQVGAGSLPTYDGAVLAGEGDLVVVTFNYRLGPFGFGRHEELHDPGTGLVANWGLQDQVAMLAWVRRNIAAFGGDAGRITLAGTSAGGASAHQLALLPHVRPMVSGIVAISAAHVRAPLLSMTPDDARLGLDLVADRLGTTVPGLRTVPAGTLLACWDALFAAAPADRAVQSGRAFRGPVLDDATMRAHDHDPPDLPVMSVHTRNEGSFFTVPGLSVLPPPPAPVDAAGLRGAVRSVLDQVTADVHDSDVRECLRVYSAAAAGGAFAADPATVWAEVLGDGLLRHGIVRTAQRHARRSRAPQYVMEFAHPARMPGVGTPHEATSKFLFGTHASPANVGVFGDGPQERRVGATFRALVASFAVGGAPRAPHCPRWPVLTPDGEGLLVLGGAEGAVVGRIEDSERLRFWDRPGLAARAAPVPSASGAHAPIRAADPQQLVDKRNG